MLKGAHLTLMIGPAVPVSAPQDVLESVIDIQVTNSKYRSGFQITFTVGNKSKLLNTRLPAGYLDPIITRVIIIITLNGTPTVLMDGLITKQDMAPSNKPGESKLTITGEDLSLAMDLVKLVTPFPAMPSVAQIYSLLAPYLVLGITPLVIPYIDPEINNPIKKTKSQVQMTSRAYVKQLAARCGYVFFVQPGPLPGQSIAYWGPDVTLPVPQPALSINWDDHSNTESLSFSLDGLAKQIRVVLIMDPVMRKIPIPVPIPNINIFKPPLGARPLMPAKFELSNSSAKDSIGAALEKNLSFLMQDSPSVTGSGSLDVMRYKNILRARMLVSVRGAGIAYDGLYYVDSVTHNIKPGEYRQSFSLSRDGLNSITPKVAV